MLLAIECVHKRDMIHRDIKPANIFINKGKNGKKILKIGDFGESNPELMEFTSTFFIGSPAYLAPEII